MRFVDVVACAAVLLCVFPPVSPAMPFGITPGEKIYFDGFEPVHAAMPLISRGRPTATSAGNGAAAVDGTYFGWFAWEATPNASGPAWIAIDVGTGPQSAMLNFVTYPGTPPVRDYRIETSADSTNGANGSWSVALDVSGNTVAGRAHRFAFAGRRWVRFVAVAGGTPGAAVTMNEIDVHDASAGADDSWIFVGDSVTAAAFSRGLGGDDFSERIRAARPDYYPLVIGAGAGGTSTIDGVAHIDEWLQTHATMRHWVIAYGTNDSANGDPQFADAFGQRLRTIVSKIQAAGRTVHIPRIPYKTGGETYLPAYNAVLDAVCDDLHVDRGPDLYAWFLAHPAQLGDGVHPTEQGSREINRLWAENVLPGYP